MPTMGGQTALNTALSLRRMGVLDKFGVTMIGATAAAIDKAEDRKLFREAMTKIGLATPRSQQAATPRVVMPDVSTSNGPHRRFGSMGFEATYAEPRRMRVSSFGSQRFRL